MIGRRSNESRRRPSSSRNIRRAALHMLRDLDVEAPIDVEKLCRQLSEQRGRPVQLTPYNFPSTTVFALWIETTDSDLIFYESDTTPEHQRHIILHEIGHMVLGHDGDNGDDSVWQEVVPTLPPHVVRKALRRASYDDAAEHDAEAFATLLTHWIGEFSATTPGTGPNGPRNRLEQAFDDPRGWV